MLVTTTDTERQMDLFGGHKRLFSPKAVRRAVNASRLPGPTREGVVRLHRWQDILSDPHRRADIGESQNRADFVRDVFENLLGYRTVGTAESYHLKWERSGEQDSRPADNLLGFFGSQDEERVRAVVELKGPGTDLGSRSNRRDRLSAVDQAFLYANKFDGVRWVIVSNFDEIRLYNHQRGATVHEQFWLRELKREELGRFMLLMRRENLLGDGAAKPLSEQLAEQTWREQAEISKRFYAEYQEARAELFQELREQNPRYPALEILESTQLLLDRLLFVMFCADRGLLPHDIIQQILWHGDRRNVARTPQSQWHALLRLFESVNSGNEAAGVSGYNGGLFAPALLDELELIDRGGGFVLRRVLTWDQFDFESQIDVDILGHIFENSISDLEQLRREITAEPGRARLGWRNREGIFYTPDWVTRYIVDHAVGRLLDEHPELGPGLRVVDPACGSGAFLIQLLPLLQERIRQVAPEEAAALDRALGATAVDLFADPARLQPEALYSAVRRSVFGVDRSHESVEITKLSFWLKMVAQGHPLPSLDSNIVQGNSLCDKPDVDPAALDWKQFDWPASRADAVVGNPPWVTDPPEYSNCLDGRFILARRQFFDLAFIFLELGLKLLREGGVLGFILPDSLLINEETEPVRKLLVRDNTLLEVVKLGEGVFPGVFRGSVIVIVKKGRPPPGHTFRSLIVTKGDRRQLTDVASDANLDVLMAERGLSIKAERVLANSRLELDLFVGEEDESVLHKIEDRPIDWSALIEHGRGIELNSAGHVIRCPYCHKWDAPPVKRKGVWQDKTCAHCRGEYALGDALEQANLIRQEPTDGCQVFLDGTDVNRYRVEERRWIDVSKEGINYKSPQLYRSPKIVFRQAGIGITAALDESNAYVPQSVYIFRLNDSRDRPLSNYKIEYILGILNSRVMLYYYFKKTGQVEWQSFPRWTLGRATSLPVRAINWDDETEIALHDRIVTAVREVITAGSAGDPGADLPVERLVMELYGLDQQEQRRVWATLRAVQQLKVIREVLPAAQTI